MRSDYFFSIQIAAYNVEPYIRQCLESILNQSEQDFEIILVDDCSIDGTGKICDEYSAKYPDKIISVHNEQNLGLLLTRRVAYKIACGKWILSVDADDLLVDGALKEIRSAIETNDCDLVLYNLTCLKQDGSKEEFKLDLENGKVYQGEEKRQVYLQRYKNDYMNSMCTKAIKREVLDMDADYSIYQQLAVGEDIFQSYPILTAAQKILYLDKSLYLYIKRKGSITNSFNANWYEEKKILWERDDEYLDKWEIDDITKSKVFVNRIREVVAFVDSMYSDEIEKQTIIRILETIKEDGLLRFWYDSVDKKAVKLRHKLYCKCIFKGRYGLLSVLSRFSILLMRY